MGHPPSLTAAALSHTGHLGTFWVTLIDPATCWHPALRTSHPPGADGGQICEGRSCCFNAKCDTQSFNASQDEFFHISNCGLGKKSKMWLLQLNVYV